MKQNNLFRRSVAASIAPFLFMAMPASVYAETIEFTIKNDTEDTITELYVSPSDDDDWGEDLLGDEELEPGDSIDIAIDDESEECEYDIQAVFEDDSVEEDEEVDLCDATYTFED
jgi:hypothetical protein